MSKSKSRKNKAPKRVSGPPGPRTRQDSRPEQPAVCQRSANVRPRYSRSSSPGTVRSLASRSIALSCFVTGFISNNADMRRRLAAVRRIAYEAADAGLLSPELAAGIRRMKGVRRIAVRLGNCLTPEQGRRLLESATASTARQLRDHAMVIMLIGCGLRRAELLALRLESIQQRDEH